MRNWLAVLVLLPLLALASCGSSSHSSNVSTAVAPPVAQHPCTTVPAVMGCSVKQTFAGSIGAGQLTSSYGGQGLDISNYQGFPDLARAKRAGLKFLIGQSNDGSGFTDFNFVTNWIRARQLGIAHGAYLFARPGCASCQAATLAAQVRRAGGMDAKALPPTIDAEVPGAYCEVPAIAAALRRDLHVTHVLTYSSPGLWGCGSASGGTLLWVAVWGSSGYSFGGWHGFVAQQFCGLHCYFPGIGGEVDRDVDHGVLALVQPSETPSQRHARERRERVSRLHADYRRRRGLDSALAGDRCLRGYDHKRKRVRDACTKWRREHAATNRDIKRLHRLGV